MRAPLDEKEIIKRALDYSKDEENFTLDQGMMLMLWFADINKGIYEFDAFDHNHRKMLIALNNALKHVVKTSSNPREKATWKKISLNIVNNKKAMSSAHAYTKEITGMNAQDVIAFREALQNLQNISYQPKPKKQHTPKP